MNLKVTAGGVQMPSQARELLTKEVAEVSGGVVPFVAAVTGIAMNATVRTLGTALLNRALTIYGVYSAATYYGGGSGGGARQISRKSALTSKH